MSLAMQRTSPLKFNRSHEWLTCYEDIAYCFSVSQVFSLIFYFQVYKDPRSSVPARMILTGCNVYLIRAS